MGAPNSSSSKNLQLPQQQQQRAPGETRKIHQRHGIGCVPVKLLYSESLTKVTKVTKVDLLYSESLTKVTKVTKGYQLLVYDVPGPNKQRAFETSMLLS